jgi:hypothetical protein
METMMNKFKEILARVRAYVARMFRSQEPAEPAKPRKKAVQRDRRHLGAHYYLTDLLDQLEEAFKSLNALRKVNKNSYNIFRKVACTVQSNDFVWSVGNQYAIKCSDIPSIGCAYIPKSEHGRLFVRDGDELAYPSFSYFKRIKNPINVQPTNDVVIELGYVLEFSDGPVPTIMYLAVDQDCNVRLLKQLYQDVQKVRPKVSRKFKREFSINRAFWGYPNSLEDIAKLNNLTVQGYIDEVFWMTMNACLSVDNGAHVRVAKGSDRLTFAIDILRTPYFFKDREKVVNENGKTKKIFHIVAAHKRVVNGVEQLVKSHTRGLRKFVWNGYRINILLNGKHINRLNDMNIDAVDYVGDDVPKGFRPIHEFTNHLSEVLDRA